ncbi:MAG: FKBP-type peptidyl-prolyl cis-trans isomerase [Nitrospiraceae bacterium]|nr:FKBP-type peptidyl-prolyl cis-trans isomerase [Nitrospiraceae bacterium]
MKSGRGVEILEEREGEGTPAQKGDHLLFNMRLFLNRGEEVSFNKRQAEQLPTDMVRVVEGVTLVDHRIVLGRRQAVAGIEQALTGMKVGGYRKVRIGPHLAYGDKGLPGLIPPNALLVAELWLREISPPVSEK